MCLGGITPGPDTVDHTTLVTIVITIVFTTGMLISMPTTEGLHHQVLKHIIELIKYLTSFIVEYSCM